MAAAEAKFEQLVFGPNGVAKPQTFMDIRRATGVLETIRFDDLKIQKEVFSQPFYSKTALGQRVNESRGAILRKNVYFLARMTNNLDDLLAQLIQFGVLSLEDREAILLEVTPLVKAVVMFVRIIGKESSKFSTFRNVLEITDNEDIVKKLDDNLLDEATNNEVMDLPVTRTKINGKLWNCIRCTYVNEGGHVCTMCSHSKDFKEGDEEQCQFQCHKCTLINQPGIMVCEACETKLGEPDCGP